MATGRLGSPQSLLGNIQLGVDEQASDSLSQSVVSFLTLAQDAGNNMYKVDAESTLSMADSASFQHGQIIAAESTLALQQTLGHQGPILLSASNSMSLSDGMVAQGPILVGAGSQLSPDHTVDKVGPVVASTNSFLTLAASTVHHQPIETPTASDLNLAHTAIQRGPLPRSVVSTLDIQQLADHAVKIRSVTQNIEFTQQANLEIIRTASSVITFTQEALNGHVFSQATSVLLVNQNARNSSIKEAFHDVSLNLQHAAKVNIKMVSASNELLLSQAVTGTFPFYGVAESQLTTVTEVFDPSTVSFIEVTAGIDHSVGLTLIQGQRIQHYLQWNQSANGENNRADGIEVDASDTLSLSDISQKSRVASAEHFLPLSHSLVHYVAQHQPENTIQFSQAAEVTIDTARAVTSALAVTHAVRFVHEQGHTDCYYSPFVGSTTDPNAPAPPPATLPSDSGENGFKLIAGSDVLQLRSPNLGDIDRLAMDRINRETRGGTLVIFADPIWPKVETLLLTFSGLKRDEAQALLTFMRTYIGQEIRLIDWENRAWKGVITNPQDPIVEDARNSFTASFEFEGARE